MNRILLFVFAIGFYVSCDNAECAAARQARLDRLNSFYCRETLCRPNWFSDCYCDLGCVSEVRDGVLFCKKKEAK